MLGRLREIDDELEELPSKLDPLKERMSTARDYVAKSEQNNPLHTPLATLLTKADRSHVANLGWLVGKNALSAPDVARAVDAFLIRMLGRTDATSEDQGQSYERSLAKFIRAEGGASIPSGVLEAALLKKVFGEPWVALDAKLRTRVMEQLHADVEKNRRWLPDTRDQVLAVDGLSIVGEGASAFGGYFAAAALVALGTARYKFELPVPGFANIPGALAQLVQEDILGRMTGRLESTAGSPERARAILAVAYIHLIRSTTWGHFERDHGRLRDALSSIEVALENGKRRIERLRDERSEILLQATGVIGFATMLVAGIIYAVQVLVFGVDE
jgi:hypothetical protein